MIQIVEASAKFPVTVEIELPDGIQPGLIKPFTAADPLITVPLQAGHIPRITTWLKVSETQYSLQNLPADLIIGEGGNILIVKNPDANSGIVVVS